MIISNPDVSCLQTHSSTFKLRLSKAILTCCSVDSRVLLLPLQSLGHGSLVLLLLSVVLSREAVVEPPSYVFVRTGVFGPSCMLSSLSFCSSACACCSSSASVSLSTFAFDFDSSSPSLKIVVAACHCYRLFCQYHHLYFYYRLLFDRFHCR